LGSLPLQIGHLWVWAAMNQRETTIVGVPGVKHLYTFPPAPAALIVEVFLREKGVSTESIKSVERYVDLPKLENRGEACKSMNPQGSIPWFVTSDDTVVAETIAMCEYAEEQMPVLVDQ